MRNGREETAKGKKRNREMSIQVVQDIIVIVISTTVDSSVKFFNKKQMEGEIMRIERVERGIQLWVELRNKLRLEEERRETERKSQ